MAVSFPRTVPDTRFASINMWLEPMATFGRSRGGTPQVRELGKAHWKGDWTTFLTDEANLKIWRAWFASLRGGVNKAFLRDYTFDTLQAGYPGGWSPKTGTLGSNTNSSGRIEVTGVPASTVVLTPGDYIGVRNGSNRHLHLVLEADTSGTAGVLTTTVEPAVDLTIFPATTTTVDFDQANAVFVIDHKSIEASHTGRYQSISFSATQSLYS